MATLSLEQSSGLQDTDLRTLIHAVASVQASTLLPDVYTRFSRNRFEYLAVLEGERVVGLCSQREIGMLLGSQFGRALNMRKPVRGHMLPRFTKFSSSADLAEVLQAVSSRPIEQFHHDIVLVDVNGRFIGLIAIRDLIRLQNRLFLANIQDLRASRDEIDRRNREMEQDLLLARQLQLSILPEQYPEFLLTRGDAVVSLRFHHRYEPAGKVWRLPADPSSVRRGCRCVRL